MTLLTRIYSYFQNSSCHSTLGLGLGNPLFAIASDNEQSQCWLGLHFTNIFSIAIRIQWKFHFIVTLILIKGSPQNFVHGMCKNLLWFLIKGSPQNFVHGMCKNLLWFDGQQRNYSKAKFPSNLNLGKRLLVKRAPVLNSLWLSGTINLCQHWLR